MPKKRPGYQGPQWGGWTPSGGHPMNSPPVNPAPPFDAQLEAQRAFGNQRRGNLLADLEVDVTQGAQRFGFKFDPSTGTFGGFDPSNPFSQAALLAKARDTNFRSSRNQLAAQGQLYAGSQRNARTSIQRGYDQGYNTLRNQFTDFVNQYLRRRRDLNDVPASELPNLY